MTNLLRQMLRDDYLHVIKLKMVELGHNNSSLAKATSFSVPHIGNILAGGGSDEAVRVVCALLGITIKDLLKEEYKDYAVGVDDQDLASGQ